MLVLEWRNFQQCMADSISNGVILLLWQLQSNVIASLIMTNNTTVVVIFPNVCLWRHSLCSNLGGVDPEKLYQATLICQYALCCCIVWPSFLFIDYCFVKTSATCDNFLAKRFTVPSGKRLPIRLWVISSVQTVITHLYPGFKPTTSCF